MELDITLEQVYQRCNYRMKRLLEYSVNLLRKAESLALKYHQDGFYLAMSFGKDSQALYHVAQLAGVKFTAHFSPTSVDPPELIRFGRTHYPEVKFEKIEKSIFQIFKEKKILPSMVVRWCCKELKEFRGAGRVTLVGVRNSESIKRSKRKEVEVTGHKFEGNLDEFNDWRKTQIEKKTRKKNVKQITPPESDTQFDQFSHHEEQMVTCVGGKDRIVVSPIIHWLDVDVWRFLNEVVRVPHCELYDQGKHRLGCIMCPMSSLRQIRRDIKEYPYVYEKWVKAIMDIRKEAMLSDTPPERHNIQRRASNPIPRTPTSYVGGGGTGNPELGRSDINQQNYPPPNNQSHWYGNESHGKWCHINPTTTGTERNQPNFPIAPMDNAQPLARITSKRSEKSQRISLIGG